MVRLSLLTLAVLALLPVAGTLYAQDLAAPPVSPPAAAPERAPEPPVPPQANTPPVVQPGPKLVEFQKLFEQWKEYLTQLKALRKEYVVANEKDKKSINEKYEKIVKEATAFQPKLTKAAESAFVENPKADPQLAEFLSAACLDSFQRGDYEEAYRLAKLLMDKGEKTKLARLLGGASAYCIGNLDESEKLLEGLKKEGISIRTLPTKEYLDGMLYRFLEDPATQKKDWAAEQEIRAKEAKANDLPRVKLETTEGDIVIELFENEAPNTVANFISLVDKGFYDGLTFHRVLDSFMAQGGCPKGTGTGGPGYKIPCECYRKDARKHFRGSLSMAHAGKDTGGSQFFITFVPTKPLDGMHTVFGRVIGGMETLSKIQRRDPDKSSIQATKIIKAKVIRKRDHKYEPKKVGE